MQRAEKISDPDWRRSFLENVAENRAIVERWQLRADDELSEVVGYTATGIGEMTWTQGNWVADAWAWAFPQADITIQNFGGLRQGVDPGVITLQDIVSMQPFNNQLYEITLTGAQVVENLAGVTSTGEADSCWPAVSGLRWSGHGDSIQVRLDDGQPINRTATYRLVVSDYVYYGGCNYVFYRQDQTPTDTGKNEREPVVEWTQQLGTTAQDPLEDHLDSAARGG